MADDGKILRFPGGGGSEARDDGESGDALDRLPCNDDGNAERIKARFGGVLKYVYNHGWTAFDGRRWTFEDGAHWAFERGRESARMIAEEARAVRERIAAAESDAQKSLLTRRANALSAWAIKSANTDRINQALMSARGLLAVSFEEFDADPYALNVENGTLRFARVVGGIDVSFRPHDPRDLISRICAVSYEPKARCPQWESHLRRVLPDSPLHADAVRRFVQRVFGLSITGETGEQKTIMFQGRGGDGKSQTLSVPRLVLGSYATSADVASFLDTGMKKSGSDASPDMARLAGDLRYVTVGEPPAKAAIAEGRLKQATGEGTIHARDLNKGIMEYKPRWKLFWEVNKRPKIAGDDDALWRRFEIVMFPVQVAKDGGPIVRSLGEKIYREEGAGVLNWLIAGLQDLVANGLSPPEEVTELKTQYRRDSSAFWEWMEACCERAPDAIEHASALYRSYVDFCEHTGVEPWSQKAFGTACGDQQILQARPEPGTKKTRRRGLRIVRTATGDDYVNTATYTPPVDDPF